MDSNWYTSGRSEEERANNLWRSFIAVSFIVAVWTGILFCPLQEAAQELVFTKFIAWLWLLGGIVSVYRRISTAVRDNEQTSYLREFTASLYEFNIILEMLLYPVNLPLRMIMGLHRPSFSEDYRHTNFNYHMMRQGIRVDTARDFAESDVNSLNSSVDEFQESLDELPGDVAHAACQVATATAIVAVAVTPSRAQKPVNPYELNMSVDAFADSGGDRQIWLNTSSATTKAVIQKKFTPHGKPVFTHVGIGQKFKIGKHVDASFTFGPQFTEKSGRVDRLVLMPSLTHKKGDSFFFWFSRISFGLDGTPLAHFHVQKFGWKGLPKWVAPRLEEGMTGKKLDSFCAGPEFRLGVGKTGTLVVYPWVDMRNQNKFGGRVTFTLKF